MADDCVCGVGLKPLGAPNCIPLLGVARKFIFAELSNSDNVRAFVDIAEVGTADYFKGLVNEDNYIDRFHPTPEFDNYTYEEADPELETTTGGTDYETRQGRTTISVTFMEYDTVFYKQLKGLKCPRIGVMIVDESGNLAGDGSEAYDGANKLKVIPVQKGSVRVKFGAKNDAGVSKVMLTFQLAASFDVGDIRIISSEDIADNLLELEDNIPAVGVASGISTTGFTVDLGLLYGTASARIPLTGRIAAEFQLTEISPTPGPVTITSVTESVAIDGRYVFVIPAATSGDVLKLEYIGDDYDLAPVTITIP